MHIFVSTTVPTQLAPTFARVTLVTSLPAIISAVQVSVLLLHGRVTLPHLLKIFLLTFLYHL